VLDFGIAKAKYRLHSTKDGRLKGKLRYMAPEQLRRDDVDRRSDVYAASVVLWEVLTGRPLFAGDETAGLIERIRAGEIPSPRTLRPSLPDAVERVVMRGLADEPDDRLPTALAMAEALEGAGAAASAREIGAWVHDKARDVLERHAEMIRALSDGEPSPTSTRTSRPKADSRLETELVVREKGDARLVFDDAGHEAAPLPSAASAAPPRQRRRAVVAVSATLAAVALTTCALVTSSARSTASAPDPEPLPTASASAPSASSLAASASSPDAGSASAEPPVAAPRSSATPPSRRPRLAKPARPGCDPPYFIDSEGHKQYHPKCL
jgi:serine/threonine-protein kinase